MKFFSFKMTSSKGEKHVYDYYPDVSLVIRWMYKIMNNFVQVFDNFDDIHEWIDLEQFDMAQNKITTIKVAGIFSADEDHYQDLVEFQRAIRNMRDKRETYFAVLTNPLEVEKAMRTHPEWFEGSGNEKSAVVIKKGDHFIPLNLTLVKQDRWVHPLYDWIESRASQMLAEYSWSLFQKAYDFPCLILLTNSVSNPGALVQVLDLTEKVAEKFVGKMNFLWTDGVFQMQKRMNMGFRAVGGFPLMALTRVSDRLKHPFPEVWLCNGNMMEEFVNDYFQMPLEDFKYKYNYTVQKDIVNTEIMDHLVSFPSWNSSQITEMQKNKQEAVIFAFNSKMQIE